jgi:hypothetical protein
VSKKQSKSESLRNWKVKPETLKRVNIECARLDVTQYELAEKALQAFSSIAQRGELLFAKTDSSLQRENGYWHQLLDVILSSETEHAISGIENILEVLAISVTLIEPITQEEGKKLINAWQERAEMRIKEVPFRVNTEGKFKG